MVGKNGLNLPTPMQRTDSTVPQMPENLTASVTGVGAWADELGLAISVPKFTASFH